MFTQESPLKALPIEISAYLNDDQVSRFYGNKSHAQNISVLQPQVNQSRTMQLDRSNISTNSRRIMDILGRFMNKSQRSTVLNEHNHKNSRNKHNAIRIQNDFILDQSKRSLVQIPHLGHSERSTGFATNTQITHARKVSDNLGARGEKTYSELNLLEDEEQKFNNYSKI